MAIWICLHTKFSISLNVPRHYIYFHFLKYVNNVYTYTLTLFSTVGQAYGVICSAVGHLGMSFDMLGEWLTWMCQGQRTQQFYVACPAGVKRHPPQPRQLASMRDLVRSKTCVSPVLHLNFLAQIRQAKKKNFKYENKSLAFN